MKSFNLRSLSSRASQPFCPGCRVWMNTKPLQSCNTGRTFLSCCSAAAVAAPSAREQQTAQEDLASREAEHCGVNSAARPVKRVQLDSLNLLEWPQLCRQVAAFASTSLAAQRIKIEGLPIGASQPESEELLRQTAEAQSAGLIFEDIHDLHPLVAAVEEERILNARHLNAVASLLDAGDKLRVQLGMSSNARDRQAEAATSSSSDPGGSRYPSLRAVFQPAAEGCPRLLAAIRHCIGFGDAQVLDRSSNSLAEVRANRRENLKRLRSESESWARKIFAQKASENPQVSLQRGRLCVSVKAGRQGELPKGSVKLGASRSGATVYVEPAPLVDLNNAEFRLTAQEGEAELAVLRQLSKSVAQHVPQLLKVMAVITSLDVINARAKHAAWLSGVQPAFHSSSSTRGSVCLPGAKHPLLLARSLPALPPLREYDANAFETSFMGRVSTVEDYDSDSSSKRDGSSIEGGEEKPQGSLPKPVDLVVPPGKTSVILTGPNTGGKTASLKTLGLLALMAKAGLFLPLEPQQAVTPGLEWFSEVLADVGDSQDLTQNLSTFSGHVHRLKRITSAVGPFSLVLLDELGSGTDPVEGGALAAVLLEWLLPRARLTFCTSHHAELKDLPVADERFVNASVEFDSVSLMPTYRLLWGTAGESQALAVAKGLGFDSDIVAEAEKIAAASDFGTRGQNASQLKDSLAEEVQEAQRLAKAAAKQRASAEERWAALQTQMASLQKKNQDLKAVSERKHQEAAVAAKQETQRVLDKFSAGAMSLEAAQQQLSRIRTRALEQRSATASMFERDSDGDSDSEGAFEPKTGDSVRLLSMGGAHAKVLKPAGSGNKLTVRMGNLTVEARVSDVAPSGRAATPPSQRNVRQRQRPKPAAKPQEKTTKRELVRVQLPDNTADLRGMRQDEAMTTLERALEECPESSVLFVIHGHGTGRLKAAVWEQLRKHPLVGKVELEAHNSGCTIVEFK